MPTHPSSSFSHAHTHTHHQPDSSPPGLAQWACYKKASAYGYRVGWTPDQRNNNGGKTCHSHATLSPISSLPPATFHHNLDESCQQRTKTDVIQRCKVPQKHTRISLEVQQESNRRARVDHVNPCAKATPNSKHKSQTKVTQE